MAEREVIVQRGAKFFRDHDTEMYEFVIDGGSKVGPRPATEEDKKTYPAEYALFQSQTAAEPEAPKPNERTWIPENWKKQGVAARRELGSVIAGRPISTVAEADMIIRAEVERREAQEGINETR